MEAARENGKTKFLLDGFPRSVEQALEFNKKARFHYIVSLTHYLPL
jgi:adenylate kinase family enzyme